MIIFWTLWVLVGFLAATGLLLSIFIEDEMEEITVEDVGITILALLAGVMLGFITVLMIIVVVWDDWGWGKKVLWKRDNG